MNKKERKANAALSDAYDYISRIQKRETQVKETVLPLNLKPAPPKEKDLYQGERIDDYKIEKLAKGHFFITVVCNGQRKEVEKRFKSVTRANEWISKYI